MQLDDLKRELKEWKEDIDRRLKTIEDNELRILNLLNEIKDSGTNNTANENILGLNVSDLICKALNGGDLNAADLNESNLNVNDLIGDNVQPPESKATKEDDEGPTMQFVYPGSKVKVNSQMLDYFVANSKSATVFANQLMTLMFCVKDVYRRSLTGSKARVKPEQKADYVKKISFGTQEDYFNAIEYHFKKSYNKWTCRLHVSNHLKNLNKFFQAIKKGEPFTKELVSSCRITMENLKFCDLCDYIQEPDLFLQLDETIDGLLGES